MEITYLGHSSFKLRGKNAIVVTDPFDPKFVGLKFPKIPADIVTISHEHHDHNFREAVDGTPVIVSGAGEYEVKGIKIIGIDTFHDASLGSERGGNTIYRIEMDGISLVHCGDLGHKLTEAQLDTIGDVGILMIPVGGYFTLDAALASEVVSQITPKIIIPMHYKRDGLTKDFDVLSTLDLFLKEMGKEGITPVPKLTVSQDKLPTETTVVVLS
ncbi:MBL fold metallo-hydrolase [Candidatus Gottesmanbacteria bacterium]|nr:MBL fold metallo-hydrolase [Candidatus Gottesmanbacteria bacterium]